MKYSDLGAISGYFLGKELYFAKCLRIWPLNLVDGFNPLKVAIVNAYYRHVQTRDMRIQQPLAGPI